MINQRTFNERHCADAEFGALEPVNDMDVLFESQLDKYFTSQGIESHLIPVFMLILNIDSKHGIDREGFHQIFFAFQDESPLKVIYKLIFNYLDTDKDRKLDIEKFINFNEYIETQATEDEVKQAFNDRDEDKDGKLSWQDLFNGFFDTE